MKRFLLDLWYRIKSPMFWVTVLIGTTAFLGPSMHYVIEAQTGWKDLDCVYVYENSMGTGLGIFTVIAPFISVLPNIKRMVGLRGGTMRYELMRCSNGKRMLTETAASSVSGGLALMLAPLLSLLIFGALWKPFGDGGMGIYPYEPAEILNGSFTDLLRAERYGLFFAVKLSFVFMYGMSINMIAFAVGSFISDSFVIAFLPMILLRIISLWVKGDIIYENFNIYLTGTAAFLPWNNTWGFWIRMSAVQWSAWVICYLIAKSVTDRRIQHA